MIFGHQCIVKYLNHIIKTNNPSHAYLFCGPKSVGKTTAALWFAQGLLCANAATKPCGKCSMCDLTIKNNHPDLYIIGLLENKKDISIQQIRELKAKIFKTTFYNLYKIVIVQDAEYLNQESSSAFLKLLEEPPKKTIFILIAARSKNILPTVLSRTEVIKFSLLKIKEIIQYLPNYYTEKQKEFIAKFCEGRIGDGLNLNKKVIREIVVKEKKIMRIFAMTQYLKINAIEEMVKDAENSTHCIISLFHDILLVKIGLFDYITHTYLAKELERTAKNLSKEAIKNSLIYLANINELRKYNINQELIWGRLFLKL